MGKTKQKKIASYSNDVAQGGLIVAVVVIFAFFLNRIIERILPLPCCPDFLMISEMIDTTELLVGVFTAQVTMIAIAFTFTGLFVELFGSKEAYLGISLREAVFRRKYKSISLTAISISAIFLTVVSYCFVAKHCVSALLFVFVINIVIVIILLKHYLMYAISVSKMYQHIRVMVENKILFAIKMENGKIEDHKNDLVNIYHTITQHISTLQQSLMDTIKEGKWADYEVYINYYDKVFHGAAEMSESPNNSLTIMQLIKVYEVVLIALLQERQYGYSLRLSTTYLEFYYKKDTNNTNRNAFFDYRDMIKLKPFIMKIVRICVTNINEGLEGKDEFYELFNFVTWVQEFFIDKGVYFNVVRMVSTIFQSLISESDKSQVHKEVLPNLYIKHYLSYINQSAKLKNIVDEYTKWNLQLDIYVYELTSLMLYLYEIKNHALIQCLFVADEENIIITDRVGSGVLPSLAINLAMMIISDNDQNEFKENAKRILIYRRNGTTESIMQYNKLYLNQLNCLKRSYKSIAQSYNDFDKTLKHLNYRPLDAVLILIAIFYYGTGFYIEISSLFRYLFLASWINNKIHYTGIKEALKSYPESGNTSQYARLCRSFIEFYELDNEIETRKNEIMSNLDKLKDTMEECYNAKNKKK